MICTGAYCVLKDMVPSVTCKRVSDGASDLRLSVWMRPKTLNKPSPNKPGKHQKQCNN